MNNQSGKPAGCHQKLLQPQCHGLSSDGTGSVKPATLQSPSWQRCPPGEVVCLLGYGSLHVKLGACILGQKTTSLKSTLHMAHGICMNNQLPKGLLDSSRKAQPEGLSMRALRQG